MFALIHFDVGGRSSVKELAFSVVMAVLIWVAVVKLWPRSRSNKK